jgi:DNA-binding transcriptional regulator GbsR (MarR family)
MKAAKTASAKTAPATEPLSAVERVVDFLGELGPRWGLPADACRVHGYLYLAAKPVGQAALADALHLDKVSLGKALAWLADYGLAERVRPDAWRTDSDPWELMMRALEERQRRETGPAIDALRECHRVALAEGRGQRTAALQIEKLLRLAEDLSAINAQAQRFSPRTLRHMVGLGGLAARFLDRTLGRGDRS